MKKNLFLLFTLSAIITFISSCRLYTSETHLYKVDIEILESPEEGKLINLGHSEKIRIEFTSDTEIRIAHAILFPEDANKFYIDGDNVQVKEPLQLTNPMVQGDMDDDAVFAIRNYDVGATEYIFEQEVDLTIYPAGTCFALYGIASPNDNHIGYDIERVYFCKKD